jgi:hypothetical protein
MNGRAMSSHGYVLIKTRDHPNADANGYVYEHRLVMEKILGRYLKYGELVHHLNGNKQDNRPENLSLAKSIAAHKASHRRPDSKLRKPDEINPIILCACGCGGSLLKYDESGRPRTHLSRHSWRKGKVSYIQEEILCACGCGQTLLKYDKSCRVRRFMAGHNGYRKIAP